MKVLETAVGAVFASTRFSLVRISVRDLVADGKSLVRNSGVGGGGQNLILKNYPLANYPLVSPQLGDLKITSTSTERQKRSQNLAPVLVIISGKSLVFSRKIITSTDFYRYCAPDASAPVVVINESPTNFSQKPKELPLNLRPGALATGVRKLKSLVRRFPQRMADAASA